MAAVDYEDSPTYPVKPEPCRLESEMTTLLQFNWGSTLLRTLQSMREANDQCDIVLTTSSGNSLNAHSALLCAASPRLRTEWKESCSQIDLGDIAVDTVKVILDFIYLGQADVSTNELGAVQQFAEQFEIEQLVEVCQRVSQERTGVVDLEENEESNEGSEEKKNKRVKRERLVRKVKIETPAAEEEAEEDELAAAAADGDDDDGGMSLDEALAVKAESDEEYQATRPRTRRRTKTTTARKKLAQKADLMRGSVAKKAGSWSCEKCGRKFKFKDGLRKHLPTHKEDDRCRCYLCDEEFDDSDNFQAHFKGHQITDGTFKCAVCDVVVGKKSALRSHVTKVHAQKKKKEHKCQLCGNIFPTKTALTIHRQEHTGQKRYQCQYCAREFYWQSNLKEHMRVHTGEKPFGCSHCDKKFTHNTNRKVHQRWHHTHEKLPPCGEKICNDTRGLETRKKPRLIHKCQMCSKQFSRRDSFTKHMHRHNGTFAFCCDYCGKGFMERECFDTHIKGHQGIASSFQCTVCKLVVTTKKGLQKHMRTMHDRDKQYQCTVCGVTFVHRSSFVAHAMIHSGQKPYRCDQCDRTFRCSSHLKGHLRIHTGEKPYSCSFCTAKFAHNNSRKAHEKQHHPDKVSGPPTVRRIPSTASGGRKRKAEQILQQETPPNPPILQPESIEIVSAEIPEDQHTQQGVGNWDTAGMYIVREGMAEHVPLSRIHGRERQYTIDESQGLLTGQVLGGSNEMTYAMWNSNGTVAYTSRSEN